MPDEFRVYADEHLRLLEDKLPGLVTALLITGSVPLADYRPGHSDIDFVAVTDGAPSREQLAILADIHTRLPHQPSYDGIYLTRAQLAADPGRLDTAPQVLAGDFRAAKPGGQLNPVTWWEVARSGITMWGQRPAVRTDPDLLRRWLLDNLTGYWTNWAAGARAVWSGQAPDQAIPCELIVWGVLGPGRLHHTLATEEVVSKTTAGWYTADRFPAWRQLCQRVVASRAGEPGDFHAADGLAACDLIDAVVADGQARWGGW